ncbi:hypothetical protein JK628_15215 [Shewanella sp. KX20019]|uniref:hypothetical protein n=1 Tax=Shewanella sp. KX20019 TaxID=2803864 RepID=UPI0019263C1D|nr:hypothetical protein [Shewanella sp. KX20019]QQX78906.1 hypothetical protein JK628_15215 [Shewanella sp. KX20019]
MVKKMKSLLIIVSILIGCEASFACEDVTSNENVFNISGKNEFMVIDIYDNGKEVESPVKEYVEKYTFDTRGWSLDEYYLKESTANDKSKLEVYVHFKADYDNAIPGAGKSFILCLDKDEMKVIRELALQ